MENPNWIHLHSYVQLGLPSRLGCLFTHVNYQGYNQIIVTYNIVHSLIYELHWLLYIMTVRVNIWIVGNVDMLVRET